MKRFDSSASNAPDPKNFAELADDALLKVSKVAALHDVTSDTVRPWVHEG